MSTFHHSPLSSDRIQRVLAALADAPLGLTTLELNAATGSTRASSDVSEANAALREAGELHRIECEFVGTNENGRRVHRYRLVRLVTVPEPAPQHNETVEAWEASELF